MSFKEYVGIREVQIRGMGFPWKGDTRNKYLEPDKKQLGHTVRTMRKKWTGELMKGRELSLRGKVEMSLKTYEGVY